jgi:hypothetical protein
MDYALQIAVEDRDILPLTNAGAFSEHLADSGKQIVYSTFDKAIFERWCRSLDAAGRPYKKLG